MIQPLATVERETSVCTDCRYARCRFRPSVIYAYLIARREARHFGVTWEEMIRDNIKTSRQDDLARGSRTDPYFFRDIVMSLERAESVGKIALVPANAARVSQFLCSRSGER